MICPNCGRMVMDFDYPENLDRMTEKYSKSTILELSQEELTFEEIVTLYTFIERADHFGGDGAVTEGRRKDGTFSNLSGQLKEMKKESGRQGKTFPNQYRQWREMKKR